MSQELGLIKYILVIKFSEDETKIYTDGKEFDKFNLTKEDFADMIKQGYIPEVSINDNAAILYFIDNESYIETLEELTILLAFRENIKDEKEFKKYADVIMNLQYIPLLFWYSRVVEYRGKNKIDRVIKAFKELYL